MGCFLPSCAALAYLAAAQRVDRGHARVHRRARLACCCLRLTARDLKTHVMKEHERAVLQGHRVTAVAGFGAPAGCDDPSPLGGGIGTRRLFEIQVCAADARRCCVSAAHASTYQRATPPNLLAHPWLPHLRHLDQRPPLFGRCAAAASAAATASATAAARRL